MSDLWKKYKKYMAAAGISIIVLLALTAFYVRYDYQQYCKEAVPILVGRWLDERTVCF